ncbi:EF-hand domain-containing protein [Crossiella cryophila]|uniref:Ca2+-binding EF-hand superfamily protein n=1 Tax=Crossiella cryophila TaxID=43355 RepID=A0A7W7CFS1_9PSEU|nr:EF-hand domain-containing protein [Crossiella cryophila]MBB4680412.1 Ca2+-binding EF-hand superfamily protein [Crossiella cryophila]
MTTAVKNERQIQRFKKWDVNGNGRIERSDYEAEARRIINAFGENETSPRGRAVLDAFIGMFEYQATEAGVGAHGSLTEQQFLDVNEKLMFRDGDVGFSRLLRPTIRAIVDLCDTDGDGEVNPAEFKKWMKAIGVPVSDADASFRAIDSNGNGSLSVEELVNAVRDFHNGTLDVPLLGS